MRSLILEGFVPPLVTPLKEDGTLDRVAMETVIESVVRAGAAAVFALGTSGEFTLLDPSTQRAVMQTTVQFVKGRVPVLVGVSDHGVSGVLEKAAWAQEAGADALVLSPLFYFPFAQHEVESFVKTVLSQTKLPLILYNIPQLAHTGFDIDVVARLAHNHRVIGIKDSSGDFIHFQRLVETVNAVRPDFSVIQGRDSLCAASLLMGADGIVPGIGNLAPELCVHLVEAAKAGDLSRARALQSQLSSLEAVYDVGPKAIAGLKMALELKGIARATLASPNAPLSEHEAVKVKEILDSCPAT